MPNTGNSKSSTTKTDKYNFIKSGKFSKSNLDLKKITKNEEKCWSFIFFLPNQLF